MTPLSCLEGYVEKLERRAKLPEADCSALLALPIAIRNLDGQSDAIVEDHPARACAFVLNGLVSRQRKHDGVRRIMGFGFPGDAVDLQSIWFTNNDHDLVTHGPTTLAYVSHANLINLVDQYPHLAKVLWHDTLVEAAIFREWTLNVGHRPAIGRIAHLAMEIAHRARPGDSSASSFDLPLSQSELAAALGLSLVHLNKSLRKLVTANILIAKDRKFTILDRDELARIAQFDGGYLHMFTPPDFAKPPANGRMPGRPIEAQQHDRAH